MKRSLAQSLAIYVGFFLFALLVLLPIVWMFVMSISPTTDLTTVPLRWIPSELEFGRYQRLFSAADARGAGALFMAALGNSIVVAGVATLISIAVALPAAYCFSRFPSSAGWMYAALGIYMMPPIAFVIPLYMTLSWVGVLNSSAGLIAVYCSILIPFSAWMLKSGFDGVPIEIEQAAQVDGVSTVKLLWHISIPLILPTVGATVLFCLMLAWDEFFYAVIFTSDLRAKTIPVAISDFASGRAMDFGLISAVGVLAALPPLVAAVLLQKTLVSGLTSGATKG